MVLCQARRKIKNGLVYCVGPNAHICGYATRVALNLICCHPKRREIVARTEAKTHV